MGYRDRGLDCTIQDRLSLQLWFVLNQQLRRGYRIFYVPCEDTKLDPDMSTAVIVEKPNLYPKNTEVTLIRESTGSVFENNSRNIMLLLTRPLAKAGCHSFASLARK